MSGLENVLLLRHGETVGQSGARYWGATDVPLSVIGRMQMRLAAPLVAKYRVRCVYTSSLSRTREAAALVAPNVPSVALAAFDEVHFGHWEGLTREEIASAYPEEYLQWERRPADFSYPGGESLLEFRARVEAGLAHVLSDPGPSVLVIAHRGVIRWALSHLLEENTRAIRELEIALGSLHLLHRGTDGRWVAHLLDFTDHLSEMTDENSPPDTRSLLPPMSKR
ncbi:Phosphoserine phosphatase 1 [bacterium HR30]|nr:Phosphoserine phosphatase 1 [bacterium HR30]